MAQKYRYDEKTNSYIPIDNDTVNNNDFKRQDNKPPRQNDDVKIIGILIWASQFVIPLVGSIIAYLYYEHKNEYLRSIGREALNFNISALLYSVIAIAGAAITFGIGTVILVPTLSVYYIAIPILGMIKASEMEVYIPHVTIRLIK